MDKRICGNTDTGFLKLIAFVTMAIDHIGAVFFPESVILRIIGRIAFPLFAYCLVIGYLYTSDVKKYLRRCGDVTRVKKADLLLFLLVFS